MVNITSRSPVAEKILKIRIEDSLGDTPVGVSFVEPLTERPVRVVDLVDFDPSEKIKRGKEQDTHWGRQLARTISELRDSGHRSVYQADATDDSPKNESARLALSSYFSGKNRIIHLLRQLGVDFL